MLQRALEQANHPGGQKGGHQIDPQPDRTATAAGQNRREHVRLIIQARHTHHRPLGVFADDIHHVIHGDTADQQLVLVNHRRRQNVQILEATRDVLTGQHHIKGLKVGVHDIADHRVRRAGHQPTEAQYALIAVLAVDHHDLVGVVRQVFQQPQIT